MVAAVEARAGNQRPHRTHARAGQRLLIGNRVAQARRDRGAGRKRNGNDHCASAAAVSRVQQHSFQSRRFTSAAPCGRLKHDAVAAVRRGDVCVADRVCECCQPAARKCCFTEQRDGDSQRARWGVLGLALSTYGVTAIKKLLPGDFPRLSEIGMDWRVFGFTLGASLLTGFLFGFAPALHISKTDVQDAMKETGRGTAGSARHTRLRHALIVTEVALSVVLLAGAGLLFRSFMRLQSVNAGFTPQQVLTAQLSPAGPKFKGDPDYVAFYEQVLDRVSAIPGVQSAGVINVLPLTAGPTIAFRVDGRPILTQDKWPPTEFRSVSSDYFRTMNIPVLQGRAFTKADDANAPRRLMINQALPQRDFPDENPLGKRLTFENNDQNSQPVWFEIVGVTANVRSLELREEPEPELYFSLQQNPFEHNAIVIRSTGEPGSIAPALREAVAEVDRTVPVAQVKTMEHVVSESVTQPRFNLFLLGLFGSIALLLSAAGIYGVTSYTVTQRTHELGIRLALGAQVNDVLRLVLGQGLAVIGVGLVLGLAASFALMRLMRSLLFGVGENDPLTFTVITFVLFLVALIACYVPARRATKVDPLTALRYE